MTGTTEKKTPPRSDQEWARDMDQRVGAVEHPTSVRCGAWVFSTDPDTDNLIASYVNGGSVVVAQPPAAGEDADSVADPFLHLNLARSAAQTVPANSTITVGWDTMINRSPSWAFSTPAPEVVIPSAGTYLIIYHLAFRTSVAAASKALLRIDGETRMAQEEIPDPTKFVSFYLVDTFGLSAGQVITAHAGSQVARDIGSSTADPTALTSLSVTRLPIGG